MSKAGTNTLKGRTAAPTKKLLFKPMVVLSLVLIGIFSFAALLALSGYADDLRKDVSGKATASSRSAIGYAGYVQLLKDMDYEVSLEANLAPEGQQRWRKRPLRIYTLVNAYQSKALKDLPKKETKLIVLPKWNTIRKLEKVGWVDKYRKTPTMKISTLSRLLDNADIDLEITQAEQDESAETYKLRFANLIPKKNSNDEDSVEPALNYAAYTIESGVARLQSFEVPNEGDKSEGNRPTVILSADERPVLVRLPNSQTYLLSEPDLLNTHGIKTRSRARLAVNIIDVIADYEGLTPRAVDIDVSIHGLGGGRNIIKLMTQPPFLAATLCLLAACGIIAWQAFSRFGDAARREPDFAQGPVSLAKSAAEFMSISNRVEHMGPDYAQLTRQQVVRNMGLIGQSQDSITRIIEAREKQREINPSFAELTTQNTTNLTDHARAMTRWKEEMMS